MNDTRDDFLVKFDVSEGELQALCLKTGVRNLYIFGSSLSPSFTRGTSDLDFLVDFNKATIDAFCELQEGLKALFKYEDIDLVTIGSLKNPFIKDEILSSRKMIYAA